MSISPLFKTHFSFSCTGCASAGEKAHSKAQKKETEINTEKKRLPCYLRGIQSHVSTVHLNN